MNGLETLLGGLFTGIIGGPLMIGMIAIVVFVVIGVAMKLSLEGFAVIMIPAFFLLAMYGFLPQYIYYALVAVCGFIIAFAMLLTVSRHR